MPRLTARPGAALKGRIAVPGDKSISHRALMLGALAIGETIIDGLLEGEDVIGTARAMAGFGARVERWNDGTWHVHGVGVGGLQAPAQDVDFGNAGTGVRLCIGLMASNPVSARFVGDASLSQRPMARIMRPLEAIGTRFDATDGDRLPMTVTGARDPVPTVYRLPVASAQVKSAVLLAGLNTPGETTVIEDVATRDHTERMLAAFGARVTVSDEADGRHITVAGEHELAAAPVSVPGDPSSAAFPLVAGILCAGSEVVIDNVLLNPSRTGLLTCLKEMGADITITGHRQTGGEEAGTITVRGSALTAIDVPASRAPSMIDEYPVLAVAAAFANGTTRMNGLAELRVKESDRLAAVAAGLEANGGTVRTGEDWMEVDGGLPEGGGTVTTHLDHRIAMAFLVMGLAARMPVTIDDGDVMATSFPGFTDLIGQLGGVIEVEGAET